MFYTNLQVRFSDCDGLGHMNHAAYFHLMEEARRDVFALFNPSLGIDAWNLIVGSARCDYIEQIDHRETVRVVSWIGHVGNSSFAVEHAVQNRMGQWAARGQAVLIHFDYGRGSALPLPSDIKRILLAHGEGPGDAPSLR